ncbi:ABC transporter permease [Vineibacter terrae]|uniref:ABC transporter permease n=1 Tax=Vineibacter terrae TaxID=2586908 RepID=UPI002E2FA289|nr:ABC transporter permease [Vineibacter terrae]HEX2885201.1 ABC transporter permease [Vineibacter terrae]
MTAGRRSDLALGALGVVGLLLLWELAARSGLASAAVFPAPSEALRQAAARLTGGEVIVHVLTSLGRILAGFALGAAAGVIIGVMAGWYRGFGAIVRPLIEFLRPIPPLAWIPMAIVWLGLGEASKVFVIFLGAFFPVLTNAYRGVTTIDPLLLRAAQTMDVGGVRLLVRVILPAALPDIATGLRVGWGLSFGVLVAAELIAAQVGMGFLINNARQVGDVGIVIFGIALIGGTNLATDWLLDLGLKRLLGHRLEG